MCQQDKLDTCLQAFGMQVSSEQPFASLHDAGTTKRGSSSRMLRSIAVDAGTTVFWWQKLGSGKVPAHLPAAAAMDKEAMIVVVAAAIRVGVGRQRS